MDSSGIRQAGSAIAKPVLWLMEMVLKITSSLAGVLTLGEKGTFLEKVGGGFSSLPEAGRDLYLTIGNSEYIAEMISDYNSLTAAAFNQKYGSGAVNYVMSYLNEGVAYLLSVYDNLSAEPVSTLVAALLVFSLLYFLARLLRFLRQRGQGSFLDRMERKAGKRVFPSKPSENIKKM